MFDERNIIIDEIDNGVLVAQINEHLEQIVADIADLNKIPDKKRTLQVTINFMPSKSRKEADIEYSVTIKPSSHIKRDPVTMHLAKTADGKPYAKPFDPQQIEMFDLVVDESEQQGPATLSANNGNSN